MIIYYNNYKGYVQSKESTGTDLIELWLMLGLAKYSSDGEIR